MTLDLKLLGPGHRRSAGPPIFIPRMERAIKQMKAETYAECECVDWCANIDKVNAGNTIMALRIGGSGYTGKQFVFCP